MATRRGFLRLLGLGAVSAPAAPAILEAMSKQLPLASSRAVVVGGQVVAAEFTGVVITNAGSGYTSAPAIMFSGRDVLFSGGGGSGATAKMTEPSATPFESVREPAEEPADD